MPNAEPEPSIPTDLDGLTALVNATREQHPDPAERAKASDALYLRLQGQVQPLMGQVTLDRWLAATGARPVCEVDECDEPASLHDCGAAHCARHPHEPAPAPVDGSAGQLPPLVAAAVEAAALLVEVMVEAAADLGAHLTCDETDKLARALALVDSRLDAAELVRGHARHDDCERHDGVTTDAAAEAYVDHLTGREDPTLDAAHPADPYDVPAITISRGQLDEFAGRTLTDDEVERMADAWPNSSIPEALGTIAEHLDK
jgi:hypothetical protein